MNILQKRKGRKLKRKKRQERIKLEIKVDNLESETKTRKNIKKIFNQKFLHIEGKQWSLILNVIKKEKQYEGKQFISENLFRISGRKIIDSKGETKLFFKTQRSESRISMYPF